MRTMIQSNAFIQLIATQNQIVFYIRNKRGGKGKIAERQRQRESERERALGSGGYSVSCKWTVKYTCLINKMVNIWDDCY
jgi:hypothetical protein